MKNTPGKQLFQQFTTIKTMFEDRLILDTILPMYDNNIFTYSNTIERGSERSPLSAKYFNSCKQYLAIFTQRSYHFLFNDASIARFHYEFDKDYRLVSYNLHWFPCPFSSEFLDVFVDTNGKIIKYDFFEYFDNIQEIDNFKYSDFSFRTPIRIDYDANYSGTKGEFHPLSHIHFQDTNTRAENQDIFCLYKFFSFIVENCYPKHNYLFYREEIVISDSMKKDSNNWMKYEKNNAGFGENIYTNFSFQ